MKATNKGTCQACGHVQKLPRGFLASHGYHVRWSQFFGVCNGSNRPPYEQDRSYICECIKTAWDRHDSLVTFRDKLLVPATETSADGNPLAWYHEYIREGFGKGEYRWRYVPIRHRDNNVYHLQFLSNKNTWDRLDVYGVSHKDLFAVATHMNEERAKQLDKEVKLTLEYIDWQKGRYEAWELKDLLPL